jgi:hypothetical protein
MEKLLTQLKLARIREVYQDWIDKASKEEISYFVLWLALRKES